MNKSDVQQIRDEIIEAALADVTFDGWSWDGVCAAAEKAGHKMIVASAVFPGKMVDVLDGFADLADRKMLEALEGVRGEDLRVRDRVKTALMARFSFLAPHKEALRQSVQFWILPTRKPRAAKIIWRTADRIWVFAGDTASDYNRYTKRGLLSGVITAATLYWLHSNEETLGSLESFVDRRIENVLQFGKVIGRFKKAS